MSADGRRAVSASKDKTLKVWDLESGRVLRTLVGHSDWIYSVAVSADGRRVVSASWDETLRSWDVETGRELCILDSHPDWVRRMALSAARGQLRSCSKDHVRQVWDSEKRSWRGLVRHPHGVRGAAVSSDGRWALSANGDRTLKIWNMETGALVATFTCDAATLCCAFAGARKIVAGDAGGWVHFLSLELNEDK